MTNRSERTVTPQQECPSLRWDKSTWHRYKPVDGKTTHIGSYVERCVRCGKERVIEVEG